MKKLFLILLSVLLLLSLVSCNTQAPQSEDVPPQETNPEADNIVLKDSKFADFLTSIVPAKLPTEATYYLEKAVTVNGVTTSTITAVKNGTLLTISETNGVKTASIVTRDTLTTIDVAAKAYSQAAIDETAYNSALDSVLCANKYKDVEFVPSGYTVVDKDHYSEVAMISDTPHIFIFDENYSLKYIVYAQADGALVTEEFFEFTSEVNDEIFVIPSDYAKI